MGIDSESKLELSNLQTRPLESPPWIDHASIHTIVVFSDRVRNELWRTGRWSSLV